MIYKIQKLLHAHRYDTTAVTKIDPHCQLLLHSLLHHFARVLSSAKTILSSYHIIIILILSSALNRFVQLARTLSSALAV